MKKNEPSIIPIATNKPTTSKFKENAVFLMMSRVNRMTVIVTNNIITIIAVVP